MPPAPRQLPSRVEVAVIGAGFSGLAAAVRLRQAGFTDVAVLERGERVGGTWRDNTYPGCACDVRSTLYSLSFAPEPRWTRRYAPSAEIEAYLERCVDRFGLGPVVHLGTDVQESRWDDAAGVWRLATNRGPVEARFLVAAPGPLAEPRTPDVAGLDTFAGPMFHSARWRHDVDLRGRRVAVVGTGASAVQIVPAVAPLAAHLVLLQRTPAWVMPRNDRPQPPWKQSLYAAVPATQRLARLSTFLGTEAQHGAWARDGLTRRVATRLADRHRARQVADPQLRARLRPGYELGCKRVLLSDDFYPALSRPNVTLADGALARVRPHAVVDAGGTEHPVDVLVLATGFLVTDTPAFASTYGRDGASLDERWAGSPSAYRGVTVAGFPNLFLLLGPGTGLGHSSIVSMAEAQVGYLVRALRAMRSRGATRIEVRQQAQVAYDRELQRRLGPTVWASGGCRSWYQDAHGRVAAIWPGTVMSYQWLMRRFEPDAYVMSRDSVPATA